MGRSAVILALLFAMLWQSVALARVGSTVNALADLEHAALHWQDAAHHHHEDGSYQLDDSTDSVRHVLIDPVGTTAALLASPSSAFSPLGSTAPGSPHVEPVPNPTFDGLLRPPRTRA